MADGLSEEQIATIVDAYQLQLTRYAEVARLVEARLRRAFRAAALPVLLSSRAKHPEDLREKLRRRSGDDPRYQFEALVRDVNRIVTDVAGCRVIVYDPRLEEPATIVVERTFGFDPAETEVHRKPSGYRATHLLVQLAEADVELSLRDAICEVQVTSIASHVFNELEHAAQYKATGTAPGEGVRRVLADLQDASRVLDLAVERLQDERARELARSDRSIEDPGALRFVLERAFGRPVTGEVERLFRLLAGTIDPLTVRALELLDVRGVASRGAARRAAAGGPPDDVVDIVLGLLDTFRDELVAIAASWRGPATVVARVIEEAQP